LATLAVLGVTVLDAPKPWGIPNFALLTCIGTVAIIAQVAALISALRQQRRWRAVCDASPTDDGKTTGAAGLASLGWVLALCSTWLAIPVSAAVVINHVRNRMIDFSETVHIGSVWALASPLAVFPYAAVLVILAAPLSVVALGVAIAVHMRAPARASLAAADGVEAQLRPLRGPFLACTTSPLALMLPFVLLGGLPMAFGVCAYSGQVINAMNKTALADSWDKLSVLWAGFAHASHTLTVSYHVGLAGLLAAATIAGALVIRSVRKHPPGADPLSWPRVTLLSAACVMLSGVLILAACPFRAENLAPWSPRADDVADEYSGSPRLRLPAVAGPDAFVHRAAFMYVGAAPLILAPWPGIAVHMEMNHTAETPEELHDQLVDAYRSLPLFYPDGPFDVLGVLAWPDAPASSLGQPLQIARQIGFAKVCFGVGRVETSQRPWLPERSRLHLRAVCGSVAEGSERAKVDSQHVAALRLADYATVDELVRRMADERRMGKTVAINIAR